MDRPADVLILGGGAAGIAAARALTLKGFTVTIVEARNRLGGRVHTIFDPLSPAPVELGAEFVHGKPREIWRAAGPGLLPAWETAGDHLRLSNGVVQIGSGVSEEVTRIMAPMNRAPEQSFRDFLERSGADTGVRAWATRYVEGFNAARAELISVQSLAAQDEAAGRIEGDRTFRLAGGYASLLDLLRKDICPDHVRFRLGTAVEEVRWRPGHVEMRARIAGRVPLTLEAPRAVITAPIGVLQSGSIRFNPMPETLAAACDGIVMGQAARITLRFRRPVWEDLDPFRNLGFLHSGERWMPVWWTAKPSGSPVITGWTGGPGAEDAPLDPADWVAPSLGTLARLLKIPEATLIDELDGWNAHNWSADSLAHGAHSYVRTGGMAAQKAFGEPIGNTLFFAGEAANAEGHAGTVHGAIASGERAAAYIWGSDPGQGDACPARIPSEGEKA